MIENTIYSDYLSWVEEWLGFFDDAYHNLIMTNKEKSEKVVVKRYKFFRSSEVMRLIISESNNSRMSKRMRLIRKSLKEDGSYEYVFRRGVFIATKVIYICKEYHVLNVGERYFIDFDFVNRSPLEGCF